MKYNKKELSNILNIVHPKYIVWSSSNVTLTLARSYLEVVYSVGEVGEGGWEEPALGHETDHALSVELLVLLYPGRPLLAHGHHLMTAT